MTLEDRKKQTEKEALYNAIFSKENSEITYRNLILKTFKANNSLVPSEIKDEVCNLYDGTESSKLLEDLLKAEEAIIQFVERCYSNYKK